MSVELQDAIRGCLLGGAAGDALGYPVEFMLGTQIRRIYGENGITKYNCELTGKEALFSDDTQMTLFTATGLLSGLAAREKNGSGESPELAIWRAYTNWCEMQNGIIPRTRFSWLCDIQEMASSRAPGITCLSAIMNGEPGSVNEPVNQSKGCGGIMRVAPIALCWPKGDEVNRAETIDELAAGAAALTHGHELGYIPSAALAHIIYHIISRKNEDVSLEKIVAETIESMYRLYADRKYITDFRMLMEQAIILSHNDEEDSENIKRLGEGWVAEETLAIAVYCSLKYQNDFSKALSVSVNHNGDSDSTGAVTGNIMGALWGYDKIPVQWKEDLECMDIILEIADDLYYGCQAAEYTDLVWLDKYLNYKR